MNYLFLVCFFLSIFHNAFAQQDFSTIYQNTDPARDSANPETKIQLHKEFLEDAHRQQDTFHAVLGNLYLANDYQIMTDYTSAMTHLIEAGNFAAAIKDTLLLGRTNHKKGAIFSNMENTQEAINYYQAALRQNEIAKDSYYIAISLEQLGRMFSVRQEYAKSNEYYKKAIPMVEKHCPPHSLSTTLINYGNSLDEQGNVKKAIEVYKRAIQIAAEVQDLYEMIPAKQNLALVYAKNDNFDEALELYHECRQANEENGWLNFLIYTYGGLALTHKGMNNHDSSYYYLDKYDTLKDSVIGTQIQSRINDLEATNELQKKDIALLQQKERTLRQKQYTKNVIFIACLLLGASGLGLWLIYQKEKRTKLRLQENRKSLFQLTKILQLKNAELRDLKMQSLTSEFEQNREKEELHKKINFYDLSILTDDDWQTFKILFEKAYPNYLLKVRRSFPGISEAEERMFIFIKLQLSNKESANIVGVQPETIKKTRSRLRKRLGLNSKENLNEFVLNF